MLYLNNKINYHFYMQPVDMRKGVFKLCGLVATQMNATVVSGDVFVFLARHKRKIKLLQWDGDGFALYEKQLSKGNFEWPLVEAAGLSNSTIVNAKQLHIILQGIIQSSVNYKKRYQLPTVK